MAAEQRKPSPHELWQQAGGDSARYRELMSEHGHLVPLRPGEKPEPLPCGWPGKRRERDAKISIWCGSHDHVWCPYDRPDCDCVCHMPPARPAVAAAVHPAVAAMASGSTNEEKAVLLIRWLAEDSADLTDGWGRIDVSSLRALADEIKGATR